LVEVSFYVLPTESPDERYQFACKLIEKAYRTGVFPYVLTDNLEQSQQLDDLLWTFRAGSFIPHQIYCSGHPEMNNIVLIGSVNPPESWLKTIINISSQCPKEFQKSERLLEILDNSEETKSWGRNRYRQYQQEGIEIITHKI
jgi:DNA polymerase III subunit chi